MEDNFYLFANLELSKVLEGQRARILEHVNSLDADRLLNTIVEDWCSYYEQEFLVNPIALHEDQAHAEQNEVQIDVSQDPSRFIRDRSRPFNVPGTRVSLTIPFDGDAQIFRCRPGTYSLNPPRGRLDGQNLVLSIDVLDHDAQKVKAELNRALAQVRDSLNYARQEIEAFNKSIRALAKGRIETRRQKILNDRGLVEAIGFPLKHRADAPATYVVPTVRRKAPIPQPAAAGSAFKPDPTVSFEEYERILEIMSNMAQVLEKSPATFKNLDEEAIRTHFLVQLNGQYQGQASGETFNSQGKTDILIAHEGKNIFVAECKFWSGPKKLLETVDQLLRYTTWRDTKTALLIFNRNKDFSAVLASIKESVPTHKAFKRAVLLPSESCFRAILSHPDDKNREIIVTIMAFEVPV